MQTVRAFCEAILRGGALADKLRPPGALDDDEPRPPLVIDAPSRAASLAMNDGSERLPKLSQLTDPAARISCLQRFAHHELQAVELFAWALLAFPAMPSGLRRGLLITLVEEQSHLQLYLDRLAAHGATLEGAALSDYFWQHAHALAASPDGPLAFLATMGLTFEQANLDFTLHFRDGFRTAGDEATALVLQRVHDDEVGHVKLATTWMARLKREGETDIDTYRRAVPFPLSAARAKGKRFDKKARERAGLSKPFIEFVERARPYETR